MDGSSAGPLVPGRSYADLSSWRKVLLAGADAFGWLNDLVSADLTGLSAGHAMRSLLLSPTGRVRAAFTVVPFDSDAGALLLIQDPVQPDAIDRLLAPYVLSSDVSLEDHSDELCLFALPGASTVPATSGATASIPSCVGPGVDLVADPDQRDRLAIALRTSYEPVPEDDIEAWRVLIGIPRFGVDGTTEDLPQEIGLVDAVSLDKGCYLGQEAMAKVRNLGHPRRLLLHVRTDRTVASGETVVVDGRAVGELTSVASGATGTAAFARVAWAAREGPFRTEGGATLSVS